MATKRYQLSGARMRELRVKRGWSRERLADELGMSYISVERYEKHRATPSIATLIEIAHRLHVAAMTLVRVNARSEPTAVVLNPTDAQNIDLLKRNNEPNNFAGPGPYAVGSPSLWGVPVVETDALAAGTALVGDFSKAVLFDRQSLNISLGTINDQFVRNMITVLGEIRAGFGVSVPRAS